MRTIGAALAAPPAPEAVQSFAHAMARKYSRARMIDGYLALLRCNGFEPAPQLAGQQALS